MKAKSEHGGRRHGNGRCRPRPRRAIAESDPAGARCAAVAWVWRDGARARTGGGARRLS
jgi:hypothetical protein